MNHIAAVLTTLFALSMTPSAGGDALAANRSSALSCDDVAQTAGSFTILDVRYPSDFQRGHIKGALSLPFYDLKKISYPKNQPVVVYCSGIGCSLSQDAAITLREMGYTKVKVLEGGFAEWSMKGYPIEGDPHASSTIKTSFFFPQWAMFRTTEVGPKELWASEQGGGKFYLLDARPAKEYAAGHLPSAHNIAADWRICRCC